MRAEVIKIGNSQGIRIPKPLLEQCGFGKVVRLEIQDNTLVISPEVERPPRASWLEALAHQTDEGDDEPLLNDALVNDALVNDFDVTEWEW
ncbi:MAG: hypothetical protein VKJ06_08975 [Vampirovibrionales bacterium]|nr:hypothetical protein [Vampirovibrionales bacterium]